MNARNTLAAGRDDESTTISLTNTCKRATTWILWRFAGKISNSWRENYTLNDHLSLSRSRYPISVSEKRNSTPIASSFSHARTHPHVSSERTLAQRSADIFEWGGPTNTLKKLGGERMKTAQDNTPDRISSVCGGVRVWRYRFCRVGPLELVRRRFKNKSQGLLWCDGGCGEDCSLGSTLSLARFLRVFWCNEKNETSLVRLNLLIYNK